MLPLCCCGGGQVHSAAVLCCRCCRRRCCGCCSAAHDDPRCSVPLHMPLPPSATASLLPAAAPFTAAPPPPPAPRLQDQQRACATHSAASKRRQAAAGLSDACSTHAWRRTRPGAHARRCTSGAPATVASPAHHDLPPRLRQMASGSSTARSACPAFPRAAPHASASPGFAFMGGSGTLLTAKSPSGAGGALAPSVAVG